MFRVVRDSASIRVLILGLVLFTHPIPSLAQHHGGHGMGGGLSGGSGRPDGVDENDSLKDFHQALAIQASSEQIAEFQELVKATNSANEKLKSFVQGQTARQGIAPFDQALDQARTAAKKFRDEFSPVQKSGLKETTKRLEKSDSDLEREARSLDQVVQAESANPQISSPAAAVDKALSDFSNLQLSLGREMGIILASGQDLSFNLPQVHNTAQIANQTIPVQTSGVLSQVAVNGDLRTFSLELTLDLVGLQQNITEVVNAQLDRMKSCGVRLTARQATMTPAAPASSLNLQLHFERWSCTRSFGQTELGEAEGSVEFRLIPSVEKSNALRITAEFKRIDAPGMMAEELRSGDLGVDLKEKVAQAVLLALEAGSDARKTLPGAIRNGVTIQTARFLDAGVGGLKVQLAGQIQITNAQVDELAAQLNQSLSAKGTTP